MFHLKIWNPYYMCSPYGFCHEQRTFPWLYPYGNQMNYWKLWNYPEKMEEEEDARRLSEMYPIMAKRLQPYVEEICIQLEYSQKNVNKNLSCFLLYRRLSKNQPALSFFLMVSMLLFSEESPEASLSRTLLSPLIIVEWSRFPRRIPMAL